MLFCFFISFGLLSLSLGQDAVNNGAGGAAGLEKRRIIGWSTRWVTRYPTDRHHGECHAHRRCCDTATVFVVPSTITETKKQTLYTYQTIPVPIPVPPCPCVVPACRQNGCSQISPPPCGCTRVTPSNSCNGGGGNNSCNGGGSNSCNGGGGGNNVICTSTIPYTTPAPSSSVIVLSTKTSSVTIYTQSSPYDGENAADPTSEVGLKAIMFSLIAAAAILMV